MEGSDAERPADRRPAVVIYRAPLFNASETFVRAHPLRLHRYRPLLAGLEDKGNIPAELRGVTFLPRSALDRLSGRLGSLNWLLPRLASHEPRLVHAHFGPDGLAALNLAQQLGIPLVTSLHGYDVSRSRRALLLSGRLSWMRYALGRQRLIDGGTLFLPVSNALRDAAIRQGFAGDRTITHYLGVDLTRFAPSEGDDGRTVLHVGRLVEKKGTVNLLRAFVRVLSEHPTASLVIIGDGPLRASLERTAAELGLGGAVSFLGAQAPAIVATWMSRAALLATPSITARDGDAEGLPTVVVEAAASGLPVVGSRHSGIPEAIEDGRTGFIVPEGSVEPLACKISEFLASRNLRRRFGFAARALAETRFDSAVQAERLEEIYDSLTAGTAMETR
jgi:glycosyltransferase involved in cell wall biosynthesis